MTWNLFLVFNSSVKNQVTVKGISKTRQQMGFRANSTDRLRHLIFGVCVSVWPMASLPFTLPCTLGLDVCNLLCRLPDSWHKRRRKLSGISVWSIE